MFLLLLLFRAVVVPGVVVETNPLIRRRCAVTKDFTDDDDDVAKRNGCCCTPAFAFSTEEIKTTEALTAATETKRALLFLLSMHRMKLRLFLLAKVMRERSRRRERKCFVPLRRVNVKNFFSSPLAILWHAHFKQLDETPLPMHEEARCSFFLFFHSLLSRLHAFFSFFFEDTDLLSLTPQIFRSFSLKWTTRKSSRTKSARFWSFKRNNSTDRYYYYYY